MDQLTNFVSNSFTDREKVSGEPSLNNNNKDQPYAESNPVDSVTSSRTSSMSPIVDPEGSRSCHDSPLRLTTSPSGSHHSDRGKFSFTT